MAIFIGLHAAHGAIEICAVDDNAQLLWHARCAATAEALVQTLRRHAPKASGLGLKIGNQTRSLVPVLQTAGFKVVTVDVPAVIPNKSMAETVAALVRSRFHRPAQTKQPVRTRRSMPIAIVLPAIAILGFVSVLLHARPTYGIINALPRPLAHPLRSAYDAVLLYFAPERDGLRWIEIDDPRARRTDKQGTAIGRQ